MRQSTTAIAPASGNVYYSGVYWNDYPDAVKEINRRSSDDPDTKWYEHFFQTHKGPYKKVLMLNCGNGWLERSLHKLGYIKELVGVDYVEDLLTEARQKAKKLPFRYYQMDVNTAKFPEADFDLVINHAAVHHIANLNKVFHKLLKVIKKDGVFLNYDYVGPHRNQYSITQWQSIFQVNQQLPSHCRQELDYPHLPTMLATDPSEAVHSELILPTMRHYFDITLFKPIGGALAYPLLTHNARLQKAPKRDVRRSVQTIMAADAEYHAAFPEHTMFAYWVARPNWPILNDQAKLQTLQKAEDKREQSAKKRQGHYYELDLIQQLYLEISELRIAKQHKQITIEELQKQNQELKERLDRILNSRSWKAANLASKVKNKLKPN